MAHALAQRHFGGESRITLYGMGGLAASRGCDPGTKSQVSIALAGPAAGFALAFLVMVLARLAGHSLGYTSPWGDPIRQAHLGGGGIQWLSTPVGNFYWQAFASSQLNFLMRQLLWVNILWGCVNLLPIYPLDGGQVARELCQLWNPRAGILWSLQISMFCAAGMGLLGILSQELFIAIFFGYFAYTSYQTFRAYRASY
jgi:Zn-dependent protease